VYKPALHRFRVEPISNSCRSFMYRDERCYVNCVNVCLFRSKYQYKLDVSEFIEDVENYLEPGKPLWCLADNDKVELHKEICYKIIELLRSPAFLECEKLLLYRDWPMYTDDPHYAFDCDVIVNAFEGMLRAYQEFCENTAFDKYQSPKTKSFLSKLTLIFSKIRGWINCIEGVNATYSNFIKGNENDAPFIKRRNSYFLEAVKSVYCPIFIAAELVKNMILNFNWGFASYDIPVGRIWSTIKLRLGDSIRKELNRNFLPYGPPCSSKNRKHKRRIRNGKYIKVKDVIPKEEDKEEVKGCKEETKDCKEETKDCCKLEPKLPPCFCNFQVKFANLLDEKYCDSFLCCEMPGQTYEFYYCVQNSFTEKAIKSAAKELGYVVMSNK
jgi:hypothetical protein